MCHSVTVDGIQGISIRAQNIQDQPFPMTIDMSSADLHNHSVANGLGHTKRSTRSIAFAPLSPSIEADLTFCSRAKPNGDVCAWDTADT